MRVTYRYKVPAALLLLPALPVLCFLLLDFLFPLPPEKLAPPGSTIVSDRNGELMRVFLAPDDMWRIRLEGDEISDNLKRAVLAFEDRYFYWHPGINPISIVRAAYANLKSWEVTQGGSTITMQVARLLEPKERTLKSKVIEAFRALQLELKYSKEEILSLYFNNAPYGSNVVGVGAASYLYFNKSADKLSLGESALLAAIPNAPNQTRPDTKQDAAAATRAKVLDRMLNQGKISRDQYNDALAEPIPDSRYPLPFLAPHLATYLLGRYPGRERLETTIDARIQRVADATMHGEAGFLHAKGISNAAAIVIDNESGDLLSMVGSLDFYDDAASGQVNGTLASRSPGSTLKPFVYALGFERGLISPQSLLPDVPHDYAGYRPQNYDDVYHGAVTVEEALVHSLNVPAVNLYADLGSRGLYSLLKQAGISTLPHDKQYYGLSLVLGGCGVTLLELTNLYAGLARGGEFFPCHLLRSDRSPQPTRLFSAGTCYLLTDILSQLQRPELPAIWEWTVDRPKVAWKTGTSYGHRDAWSIGYTPKYTIGVWVGNFSGKGARELVGAEIAAPILFDLFAALDDGGTNGWFSPPEQVAVRQVCALSGMPPSESCDATKTELYLPGISSQQQCTYHRKVMVDKCTGQRLCSHCRESHDYEEKVYVIWPHEIATWMERNGYPIARLPEHNPACSQLASGQGPVIYSPLASTEYKLRPGVPTEYQQILLDAKVSNGTNTIYWFLDRNLVYSGPPTSQLFIEPTPGAHTLICLDDEGRSAEVSLTVTAPQ